MRLVMQNVVAAPMCNTKAAILSTRGRPCTLKSNMLTACVTSCRHGVGCNIPRPPSEQMGIVQMGIVLCGTTLTHPLPLISATGHNDPVCEQVLQGPPHNQLLLLPLGRCALNADHQAVPVNADTNQPVMSRQHRMTL